MLNSILMWILSMFGKPLFFAGLQWIEKQFPGAKAIIDQIVKWLQQGVPVAEIQAHLNDASFKSPQGGRI